MSPIAAPELPTGELQALLDEGRLPTMPQATLRIMELASDPFTSLDHVATVVASDPALSGRVLGLANSVLFYRGTRFESIDRAVTHLGVMRVRSLALALHLFTFKPGRQDQSFDYEYFWRYCLTCAVAAKLLAARQAKIDPEEAFVAALLQDIGVLACQQAHPEEYRRIFESKTRCNRRLHEVELEAWGHDHAHVGAAIAAYWGLPAHIGSAIQLHHCPGDNVLANLCHLADLVHAVIYESTGVNAVCLGEELRAKVGDEIALLRDVEIELPHIAEACSCPAWTDCTEVHLKQRIASLIASGSH